MIALLAAAAVAATTAPATDMAAVERVYATSCGERAYATYDDVCNTLRTQLGRLRKEEAQRLKAEQLAAAKAKKTAATTTAEAVTQKP